MTTMVDNKADTLKTIAEEPHLVAKDKATTTDDNTTVSVDLSASGVNGVQGGQSAEVSEEPWGDVMRRKAKESNENLKERVRNNLECLMRNSAASQLTEGKIKFPISMIAIPKTATLTDECPWKALVDEWADKHKLQVTFHPKTTNCYCKPSPSKLKCQCTPKITLSW